MRRAAITASVAFVAVATTLVAATAPAHAADGKRGDKPTARSHAADVKHDRRRVKQRAAPATPEQPPVKQFVVRYESDTTAAEGEQSAERGLEKAGLDAQVNGQVKAANNYRVVTVDTLIDSASADAVAATIERQSGIASAEPNGRAFPTDVITPAADPNDPDFYEQWDLSSFGPDNYSFGVNAHYGWAKAAENGPAPVIAVSTPESPPILT